MIDAQEVGTQGGKQTDVLRVEDLQTYFFLRRGVVKAVDGVSFTVRRGEVVGLVGESGCGKTITCLSIMQLVPRNGAKIIGGKVLFQGEDLLELSQREMRHYRGRRIAMIMQDPQTSLNPVYTTGNQVAEPIRHHLGERGAAVMRRVLDALRAVHIPAPEERVGQYPHQLSGGMRQRVVAAMGLTTSPDLLIADEPTTALDVTIQAQFLLLIKELQEIRGTAVIWVTHDLGIIAQLCDRVNILYAGRIVEGGDVKRIFQDPQHPYTKALLESVPRIGSKRKRLYQIDGMPPDLSNVPTGCPFRERCPEAMDICAEEYPPQTHLGGDNFVHCWLKSK